MSSDSESDKSSDSEKEEEEEEEEKTNKRKETEDDEEPDSSDSEDEEEQEKRAKGKKSKGDEEEEEEKKTTKKETVWGLMKQETLSKKQQQAREHWALAQLISDSLKDKRDPFGVGGETYDLILADPPWPYDRRWTKGSALEHYPTMKQSDIDNMPVLKLANKNCMLLLWVTAPKLADGFKTMEKWGFTYKTIFFTWIKMTKNGDPKMGMGNYTRPSTELCLLGVTSEIPEETDICLVGTKGNIKIKEKKQSYSVRQVIHSVPREHSRKPDEQFERLEEFFGNNYDNIKKIELFARGPRKGWSCWGNQINKFAGSEGEETESKTSKKKTSPVKKEGNIADLL